MTSPRCSQLTSSALGCASERSNLFPESAFARKPGRGSTMPLPIPKSRAEIAALQRQRKVAAVENALRAPFHRKRLQGIDPERAADPAVWREIPLLLKEELRALPPQQFFADFCLAKPHEIAEYWRS